MNTSEQTNALQARRPANHRLAGAEKADAAQRRRWRGSAAVVVAGLLAGSALAQGPADMASRLACPDSPNCVNSLGVGGLAPMAYTGSPEQGMARLRAALASFGEASVQTADASSLTAIFTTRLRFRDEVVFVLDASRQQIHFRSRSLTGYYDFGKNRSRMQAVAERFAQTPAP
jgi:uncharacterized protein (DUF1499 family)